MPAKSPPHLAKKKQEKVAAGNSLTSFPVSHSGLFLPRESLEALEKFEPQPGEASTGRGAGDIEDESSLENGTIVHMQVSAAQGYFRIGVLSLLLSPTGIDRKVRVRR